MTIWITRRPLSARKLRSQTRASLSDAKCRSSKISTEQLKVRCGIGTNLAKARRRLLGILKRAG